MPFAHVWRQRCVKPHWKNLSICLLNYRQRQKPFLLIAAFNHLVHQATFLFKYNLHFKALYWHFLLYSILQSYMHFWHWFRVELRYTFESRTMGWQYISLIFHVSKGHMKIYCLCFGHEKPSLGGVHPYIFFGRGPPKGSVWPLACRLPRQPHPPSLLNARWKWEDVCLLSGLCSFNVVVSVSYVWVEVFWHCGTDTILLITLIHRSYHRISLFPCLSPSCCCM